MRFRRLQVIGRTCCLFCEILQPSSGSPATCTHRSRGLRIVSVLWMSHMVPPLLAELLHKVVMMWEGHDVRLAPAWQYCCPSSCSLYPAAKQMSRHAFLQMLLHTCHNMPDPMVEWRSFFSPTALFCIPAMCFDPQI